MVGVTMVPHDLLKKTSTLGWSTKMIQELLLSSLTLPFSHSITEAPLASSTSDLGSLSSSQDEGFVMDSIKTSNNTDDAKDDTVVVKGRGILRGQNCRISTSFSTRPLASIGQPLGIGQGRAKSPSSTAQLAAAPTTPTLSTATLQSQVCYPIRPPIIPPSMRQACVIHFPSMLPNLTTSPALPHRHQPAGPPGSANLLDIIKTQGGLRGTCIFMF